MSIGNLTRVVTQIDDIDWREGMVAYPRYRDTMQRLGDHYGYSLSSTTAAFCALSPNNDYWGNLRSLVTLMRGRNLGADPEDLIVSTYNQCKFRAWKYLNGDDFLAATRGPKTRAFYQNILKPSDPAPVTVDGHMYSIWVGERMTMVDAVRRRIKYEIVADGIRVVARHMGVIPNQLQSMLWFTWKRVNGIKYKPQMGLFYGEDQWRLVVDPSEVECFD